MLLDTIQVFPQGRGIVVVPDPIERPAECIWVTGNVDDKSKKPDHHRHADNYDHIADRISTSGIGVMAV